MSILETLTSFFRHKNDSSSETHEEIVRKAFKGRCHDFKSLLSANKRALESMANLEEAMRGERFFNLSFIRRESTTLAISLYKMVRHLNSLTGNAYPELAERVKLIQQDIDATFAPQTMTKIGVLVLPLKKCSYAQIYEVGGKMASLGEAWQQLGQNIPDGFAITASAYRFFIQHNNLYEEIYRLLQLADFSSLNSVFDASNALQKLIMSAPVPNELKLLLTEQVAELQTKTPGLRFAVRSSAIGEDSKENSFAGQYSSELNVSPENICEAYKKVIAGKYSVSAMTYRFDRGIPDDETPMCVGCMAMVDAVAGGVSYSRDPLGITKDIVVNAVSGLPKAVVDGTSPIDVFTVAREVPMSITSQSVSVQDSKMICHPKEGLVRVALTGDAATLPCITEKQVLEVAKVTQGMEVFYGVPQDIEWAYGKDGQFILLQSRPLVGVEAVPYVADHHIHGTLLLSGGVSASSGVAAGKVYHVRTEKDMLAFPQGAILVVEHANARWAPVLRQASAIISDIGGTVGHLASVAREYGIPALLGVPDAFKTLIEGQEISVDADGSCIYEGILENLVRRKKPRQLFIGSPVHKKLGKIVPLIVPLNLIDPDSPDFTPAGCQTFHDITRFCHEKAVEEMFRMDTNLFSAPSGRQLCYQGGKLQYYVVNIDQGFCGPVDNSKYVDMEQICCHPMKALWEGMLAIPWDLPASRGRGFFSVVAESALNPELEITHSSTRLLRNYFLIDRDFCNLQASFGYHFCTIEAQAGEDDHENYITFHFKGGAANLTRRTMRVLALADILFENGFIVDVKEDALSARAEDLTACEAYELLNILGYLLIHSRQMDAALKGEDSRISFADLLRKGVAQTLKVCGTTC